jgi:hypothetical protein
MEKMEIKLCNTCKEYGLPCLNCADVVYKGKLGPGYDWNKKRRFLICHRRHSTITNDIIKNMEKWMKNNIDVKVSFGECDIHCSNPLEICF